MENKKFALLIDSENVSHKYLDAILSEVATFGMVTYKRMYGDFTNQTLQEWNKKAIEYSIVQVQQPRYSTAKNASDIMLVIDAMDILHDDKVDGFCIVSSDSDFTRLVNRICEGGKEVVGMGNKNASRSLKAACTEYKALEILLDNEEEEDAKVEGDIKEEDTTTGMDVIHEAIRNIIHNNQDKGKETGLGEIGSRLINVYSDFDVRNYGYKSLTTFLEDMDAIELDKQKNACAIKTCTVPKNEMEKFIITIVQKKAIEIAKLGQKIHNEHKNFKVKEYGYTKFESFIKSFPELVIEEDDKHRKFVKLKK